MKKILPITLFLVTAAMQGEAQQFIASFGIQHNWGVPQRVSHIVYDDYYDYNWVHTARVPYHGSMFFDVVLQRRDVFIQLRLDNFGRVVRRDYWDYYPLQEHVCNGYCGYHTNYYNSHYSTCSSHNHHGHNHVVYTQSAHHGYYPHTTNIVYNSHGHGNSHGYSYDKHNKGYHKGYSKVHEKDKDHDSSYQSGKNEYRKARPAPERRGRYYDAVKNDHGRQQSDDSHKTRSRSHDQKDAGRSYARRGN